MILLNFSLEIKQSEISDESLKFDKKTVIFLIIIVQLIIVNTVQIYFLRAFQPILLLNKNQTKTTNTKVSMMN